MIQTKLNGKIKQWLIDSLNVSKPKGSTKVLQEFTMQDQEAPHIIVNNIRMMSVMIEEAIEILAEFYNCDANNRSEKSQILYNITCRTEAMNKLLERMGDTIDITERYEKGNTLKQIEAIMSGTVRENEKKCQMTTRDRMEYIEKNKKLSLEVSQGR